MGFRLNTLSLLLILGTPGAFAQERHFAIDGAKITLEIPARWETEKDLMGMPFTVLGVDEGGGRPVLAIVPTGDMGVRFDGNQLAKSQSDYKKGREDYLEEIGGKSIEYYPYKKFKNHAGIEIHSIGYRYALAGSEYKEFNFYLSCKNQLFQLQTLVRAAHPASVQSAIDQMVGSFRCE